MIWGVCLASAWWFQPTPLKNDRVKVSWDDDIPNWMDFFFQMFQNHQPVIVVYRDVTIWYKPCMVDIWFLLVGL